MARVRQTHFVRIRGNAVVECGFDILRQGGVVDNQAEFRIQLARTWIEIERADEKARAVY
jgi:hypothetical protein